jgi:GTP-binding protein
LTTTILFWLTFPGLIEGAHEGLGLGDRFLGHVERTSVLLHLVDITQEDPLEAYHTIREELTEYGAGLDEKIEILALNKIDAIDPEIMISIADQFEKDLGSRPYLISGVSQEGIRPILFKLAEIIESEKKRPEQEELSKHHVPYDPASNIR